MGVCLRQPMTESEDAVRSLDRIEVNAFPDNSQSLFPALTYGYTRLLSSLKLLIMLCENHFASFLCLGLRAAGEDKGKSRWQ